MPFNVLVLVIALAGFSALAADLPTARPEDVGLSSERLSRISASMQRHIDHGDISGSVTLVSRRGRVAHFDARGMMDLEARKPMQRNAMFRIASMTKPITSVAVMMLYEEGRFLLEDPVSKFIPEFRAPRVVKAASSTGDCADFETVPAEREITIRHLLTHTAGLPNTGSGATRDCYRQLEAERYKDTVAAFTKSLARLPLNFQPGTAWEYGPATDVLGRVVEVVAGMSFEEFLEKRLFKPLRMVDTMFFVPPDGEQRLAVLYTPVSGKGLQPFTPRGRSWKAGGAQFVGGAGGLVSTAEDYFRFCQMLLNGGELDGIRVLGRKSVELMTSNAIGGLPFRASLPGHRFGLGFRIQTDVGESAFLGSPGTYGWDGAFNTHFWIDPKEQMIGILMLQLEPYGYLKMRQEFQVLATSALE
jgi:CubicO group peptidase (beta-lactamase class C family)